MTLSLNNAHICADKVVQQFSLMRWKDFMQNTFLIEQQLLVSQMLYFCSVSQDRVQMFQASPHLVMFCKESGK